MYLLNFLLMMKYIGMYANDELWNVNPNKQTSKKGRNCFFSMNTMALTNSNMDMELRTRLMFISKPLITSMIINASGMLLTYRLKNIISNVTFIKIHRNWKKK